LRLSAAPAVGATAVLRFTAVAGRRYSIWSRDALRDGTWQILQAVPNGATTRVVEVPDPVPSTTGQRYYRLQLDSAP
jgi:hypothetical protein